MARWKTPLQNSPVAPSTLGLASSCGGSDHTVINRESVVWRLFTVYARARPGRLTEFNAGELPVSDYMLQDLG